MIFMLLYTEISVLIAIFNKGLKQDVGRQGKGWKFKHGNKEVFLEILLLQVWGLRYLRFYVKLITC